MTILERLTQSVGIAEEDALRHLAAGFVHVDGDTVTDPDAEVTATARLLLNPPTTPAE